MLNVPYLNHASDQSSINPQWKEGRGDSGPTRRLNPLALSYFGQFQKELVLLQL
jgi:hypothetical protein